MTLLLLLVLLLTPAVTEAGGHVYVAADGFTMDIRANPVEKFPEPQEVLPPFWEYFFRHQYELDWYRFDLLPDTPVDDLLWLPGQQVNLANEGTLRTSVTVIMSQGCLDQFLLCQLVQLERGFLGSFASLDANHPYTPRYAGYIGVPYGSFTSPIRSAALAPVRWMR